MDQIVLPEKLHCVLTNLDNDIYSFRVLMMLAVFNMLDPNRPYMFNGAEIWCLLA